MAEVNLIPISGYDTIRGRVTTALRGAIITGEMQPGEIYSAPSLATMLGVSATPVREAMLDLAKEGLVKMERNKGFRVTEVDDKYLDDITALRQLIEPPVARDVVQLIPDEDLPKLRAQAQEIVDRAAEHNLAGYLEADRFFHLAILAYSGNDRIVQLIDDLRGHMRLGGLSVLSGKNELAHNAMQHIEIVDAIQSRNAELVFELMVDHISQTRSTWAGASQPPAE